MAPNGGEIAVVNWLTTLGVGGALAAFMFVLYRRDIKQYTDLWMKQSDQLLNVVKENTASNVELVHLIRSKFDGEGEVNLLKKRVETLERVRGAGR